MPFRINQLLLLFLTFCTIGCTTKEDDCETDWQKQRTQLTASARIEHSELRLEVTSSEPGPAIQVFQDGLSGDFHLFIRFDAFSGGTGEGGYAQFSVSEPIAENESIAGASIGLGLIDAFVDYPSSRIDSRFTTGTSGTIELIRQDTIVSSTVTVGDNEASVSSGFTSNDLQVTFEVGSNRGQLSGTTAITITEFQVLEGEGINSEAFDCEAVL